MKWTLINLALVGLLVLMAFCNSNTILDDSLETMTGTLKFFYDDKLLPALENLHSDIGRYPSTAEGLGMLVDPPKEKEINEKWKGPYIDFEIPLDPWGRPYQYRYPGKVNKEGFDLFCLGSDGFESEDDIGNWN